MNSRRLIRGSFNYYRLKHVYSDGHYDYSKTIAVKAAEPEAVIIASNPANQLLQLELKNAATIIISGMSGKTMQVIKLEAGRQMIATGQLSNGIYLLQAVKGGRGNTVYEFSVFR